MANPPSDPQASMPPSQESSSPAKRPRKKRRLLKGLLVLILLLAVLVGALPWLASTSAGTAWATSFASGFIKGEIAIDTLALGWGGPLRVEGLTVRDPDGEDALKVSRVTCSQGLWSLITDYETLGTIEVASPDVILAFDEEGNIALLKAFELVSPSEKQDTESELPALVGNLDLTEGKITVTRPGHEPYSVTAIGGQVDLDTLNTIAAKLSATLPDGAALTADADIRQLFASGAFSPSSSQGSVTLKTDKPTGIGPLLNVMADQEGYTGTLQLSGRADLKGDDTEGQFDVTLTQLQRKVAGTSNVAPLDVLASAKFAIQDDILDLTADLGGTIGKASLVTRYPLSADTSDLSGEKLLSAILAGEKLALPDVTLNASAEFDLAAIDRAVPGLLNVREDLRLNSGRVVLQDAAFKAAPQPALSASLSLTDFQATSGTQTVSMQPMQVGLNAGLVEGKGLQVEKLRVDSSFANITASGWASELQAEYALDLTAMQRDLGQIFDLGEMTLDGKSQGTLKVTRADDETLNTTVHAEGSNLRFAAGPTRSAQIDRFTLDQQGRILLDGQSVSRIEANTLQAEIPGRFAARGSASIDISGGGMQTELDLPQADLAFLSSLITSLGVEGMPAMTGQASGNLSVNQSAGESRYVTAGRIQGKGIMLNAKKALPDSTDLTWSNLAYDAKTQQLLVAEADVRAGSLALDVDDLSVNQGTPEGGSVGFSGDVQELLALVNAMSEGTEAPPAIKGRLTLISNVANDSRGVRIKADGNIADLEIGSGTQVVRDKSLEFALNAGLDAKGQTLTLETAKVQSRFLSADLSGRIDQMDTAMNANITGKFTTSWKELTTLMHELSPATREMIEITGNTASELQLNGPLSDPNATPGFRKATAKTTLGWDSARLMGVDVGKATLQPQLADAVITLPPSIIATAQGKVRLAGSVDLKPDEPLLLMPGTNRVLDGVKITPELTRQLLSRINPVFYYMADADGTVHLDVNDLRLPLGETMLDVGQGSGKVDLVKMRAQPSGWLSELLVMGKIASSKEMLAVELKGGSFRIDKGRIHYRDITLIFAQSFDAMFSGSVGLDETLDLIVSVPIRAEMLRQMGVKGAVEQYAQMLEGTRIEIPLVGTRKHPQLDLSKVDTEALLKDVLKKGAENQAKDLLKGLLK